MKRDSNQLRPQNWAIPAPRRWVVELTIAWLGRHLRLLCDFERLVQVGMGWVYAAMTFLMVRRLAQ